MRPGGGSPEKSGFGNSPGPATERLAGRGIPASEAEIDLRAFRLHLDLVTDGLEEFLPRDERVLPRRDLRNRVTPVLLREREVRMIEDVDVATHVSVDFAAQRDLPLLVERHFLRLSLRIPPEFDALDLRVAEDVVIEAVAVRKRNRRPDLDRDHPRAELEALLLHLDLRLHRLGGRRT